jgi:hypothetical protein
MREYLLFSQIPAAREHQVLSILAGVTVAQPVPIYEQVLLYGQLKVPEAAVSKKVGIRFRQGTLEPETDHRYSNRNRSSRNRPRRRATTSSAVLSRSMNPKSRTLNHGNSAPKLCRIPVSLH